jgi:hypothetical protein
MTKTLAILLSIIVLSSIPYALAETVRDEKLEFAITLQQTLGHFWAIEKNLDDNNTKLALVHATHPISELYETMSEQLVDYPIFAEKLKKSLLELKDKASTKVDREDAKAALSSSKEIIGEAAKIAISPTLYYEPAFKMQQINALLEITKVEYDEAIDYGIIVEMAEFQDGSAFVWRSQQIFESLQNDIPREKVLEINENYDMIWIGFDNKISPPTMVKQIDILIEQFEDLSGFESGNPKHDNLFVKNTPSISDRFNWEWILFTIFLIFVILIIVIFYKKK